MFDNRGAHCACAAPRARPSPAPPERARRPGARRSRAHAALRGRWDTRPGKWAVGRGLATRRRRGGRALRAGLLAPNAPLPCSLFSWNWGPSFRLLYLLQLGESERRGAGSLGKFTLFCCLLPLAARRRFSRPRWKLGICTAKAFCCTFPVYVVQMGILETCHRAGGGGKDLRNPQRRLWFQGCPGRGRSARAFL